jgi:thioester reductase-like protein
VARSRSLSVTVYRPSRILGHSRTGACQRGDYLWLILKGCIQAQVAPSGMDTAFDLVPVDYVSDAIVALSQRSAAAGRTFHLTAGKHLRLDTALDWLRHRGYPLACLEPRAWLDTIATDPGNAAFPLLGTLAAELTAAGSEGRTTFDSHTTDAALAGSGVRRTEVDEAHFNRHVDYFLRTGWLHEA